MDEFINNKHKAAFSSDSVKTHGNNSTPITQEQFFLYAVEMLSEWVW